VGLEHPNTVDGPPGYDILTWNLAEAVIEVSPTDPMGWRTLTCHNEADSASVDSENIRAAIVLGVFVAAVLGSREVGSIALCSVSHAS